MPIRLNELTMDEFFDVYRMFRPETTQEEYEVEWALFQEYKAAYLKRLATN
jgi:hypothetical protein